VKLPLLEIQAEDAGPLPAPREDEPDNRIVVQEIRHRFFVKVAKSFGPN